MSYPFNPSAEPCVTTFDEFVRLADYSLMDTLNADPDATVDGSDHRPRQVFLGSFRTCDTYGRFQNQNMSPIAALFLRNLG